MHKNLVNLTPPKSSFLSIEKDSETIIKKLFVESRPYDEKIKRLLIIHEPDCLSGETDEREALYQKTVNSYTVADLIKNKNLTFKPKVKFDEFDEKRSMIIVSQDSFIENSSNEHFRDCLIHFDILCPLDDWEMNDYQLRPLKIAGYIDGLLNKQKLSGIGTLNFVGCSELIINENLAGYCLTYLAVHGSDDQLSD